MVLAVHNQATEPLELDLEKAQYIASDGQQHALFFWTVTDAGQREAPAELEGVRSIAQGTTRLLSLWPEIWTSQDPDGMPSTWRDASPFDGGHTVGFSRDEALDARAADKGRQFEIVLPVKVGNKRYTYRFSFTATTLHTKRTMWA